MITTAFFMICLCLGLVGIAEIRSLGAAGRHIGNVSVAKMFMLDEIEAAMRRHEIAAENSVEEENAKRRLLLRAAQDDANAAFRAAAMQFETLDLTPEERRILDEVKVGWSAYLSAFAYADMVARTGRFEKAKDLFEDETEEHATNLYELTSSLSSALRQEAEVSLSRLEDIVPQSQRFLLSTLGVAGVFAIWAAIWAIWRLSLPLMALDSALRKLLAGQETVVLPDFGSGSHELSTVSASARALRDSIRDSRKMARHDLLTGLPNRRAFAECIDESLGAQTQQGPVAVLLIDLDRFKHVNDTLGHGAGDTLLQLVAQRLQGAVRQEDTVSRFGGDEFAIVQTGGQRTEDSLRLGRRVVELLSEPFEIKGREVLVGASVGIALAPQHGQDAEDLMCKADLALYAAKADGRGRSMLFEPQMLDRQRALSKLQTDLKKALKQDEFTMVYQPIISLDTGRVTGAEALLRWRHPTRGPVSPGDFVPLAEELGLIVPLGAHVLRRACSEAATWPAHLSVAVNLSPVQLRHTDILAEVGAALGASGLPASRLIIEITEGVFLEDTDDVKQKLERFRDMGVRISLDDFGTGYSSLRYLRNFRFDKLKIDASFVQEDDSDQSSSAVIRSVCLLCSSLGIDVVAEGIETTDQLRKVVTAGCNEAQGFLLEHPLSSADFVEFDARTLADPPLDILSDLLVAQNLYDDMQATTQAAPDYPRQIVGQRHSGPVARHARRNGGRA